MTRPMVVWNNILERNIVLIHEVGGELCGALYGEGAAVARVLTHF